MVGAALKYLQDTTVPWQRVVGSGGIISERGDGGEGATYQADLRRSEGVEVVPAQSDRGRWRVHSFAACAWGTLGLAHQMDLRSSLGTLLERCGVRVHL